MRRLRFLWFDGLSFKEDKLNISSSLIIKAEFQPGTTTGPYTDHLFQELANFFRLCDDNDDEGNACLYFNVPGR